MKFGYTILYVEDVESTLEFYEGAFGFSRKFMTPEKDYGELVTGETTIAFASNELGKSNFRNDFESSSVSAKPFGVELALVSENIDLDLKRAINAGAKEFEPLIEKPWGQKVGYVRDNNGFIIEICTPVSADHKADSTDG